MNFETVIGLEVHVELNTDSKVLSPAPAIYGAEPNTATNEIDWAYPGALPTLNKKAIDYAMRAALAINCDINQSMMFDRKNYFYPDNPAGYQISQDVFPIGEHGHIDIEVDGETRRIGIERLHLEQDAGKNIHGDDGDSYVDLNRQGTSLLEIVSEPEIRSPEEAYAYLETLQQMILFTGVSDVKMEEGSLRCDANISIRPQGSDKLYPKTELKNLNSLSFVRTGLEYEEERQRKVVLSGEENVQQTRRFDPDTNKTIVMRYKDEASEYRIIPEPDVPPIHVSDSWLEDVRASIPEMPKNRRKRYVDDFDIPEYDAEVLTQTKEMSDFFEASVEEGADPKQASNWLMGDVSAYLNKEQRELSETELTPEGLADMIQLIDEGTISSKIAKKLFTELIEKGGEASEIVEENNWKQLSDPDELRPIIAEVLDENPQSIEDIKGGKDNAIGFLVGQTMKATRGQANPQMVNQILREEIDKR